MKEIAGIKLYTVNEILESLEMSRPTFNKFVSAGEIKVRKIGGSQYVTEKDLQRFLIGDFD